MIQGINNAYVARNGVNAEITLWIARVNWIANAIAIDCGEREVNINISK